MMRSFRTPLAFVVLTNAIAMMVGFAICKSTMGLSCHPRDEPHPQNGHPDSKNTCSICTDFPCPLGQLALKHGDDECECRENKFDIGGYAEEAARADCPPCDCSAQSEKAEGYRRALNACELKALEQKHPPGPPEQACIFAAGIFSSVNAEADLEALKGIRDQETRRRVAKRFVRYVDLVVQGVQCEMGCEGRTRPPRQAADGGE